MQPNTPYYVLTEPDGSSHELWFQPAYARAFPKESAGLTALRGRIYRRHTNGLARAGGVRETVLGILVVRDRYEAWLLAPRARAEYGSESAA